MIDSERPDFEAALRKLCGGYDRVCDNARIEAYWQGLAKMPLVRFLAVVDHCLTMGDKAPPKLPDVRAVWGLSQRIRAPMPMRPAEQDPAFNTPPPSPYERAANYLLLAVITSNVQKLGGVVPPERGYTTARATPRMEHCVRVLRTWQRTWIEEMQGMAEHDEHASRENWARCMTAAFAELGIGKPVLDERTAATLQRSIEAAA